MGAPSAVHEALHGLSQVAAGQPVDVERLAGLATTRGRAPRALLEAALAGAHLGASRLVEAERDARSAVGFFATTDFLTFHANSLLILGDVLRAAGRRDEADLVYRQALDLYRQKGSLVGVKSAEARLAV
jgi:hypothetical protein